MQCGKLNYRINTKIQLNCDHTYIKIKATHYLKQHNDIFSA